MMARTLLGAGGLFTGVFAIVGCGGRTEPFINARKADVGVDVPVVPDAPECVLPSDCRGDLCNVASCVAGRCVSTLTICDDKDPCTDDICDPAVGCTAKPSTLDLDGDGHRSPLPGKKPGEPGSCGDDCDDRNAKAHPGAVEICDGLDNDCDGIVDNDARYVPVASGPDALRISGEVPPATPSGFAFSGEEYFATYTGTEAGKTKVYGTRLDRMGTKVEEKLLTRGSVDAQEGQVVWNGATFGLVWSDRRDGSWETYFSRLNAKGEKLDPDLAVAPPDGKWSLDSTIVWTSKEFVLAWQDEREDEDYNIWAQRIDVNGKPVGENVRLVAESSRGPHLAVGRGTLALTWTHQTGSSRFDSFLQIFDLSLKPISSVVRLNELTSAEGPHVIWNGDRYVVAFTDRTGPPKTIYAAAYDETGANVVPTRQVTDSPRASRYPSLLPLGDRVLMVWSDTKDSASGYEIYSKMLDSKLNPIGGENRVTKAIGDSVGPGAVFGPDGDVAVLFRDDRLGAVHTYFARLVCTAGK